MKKNNVKILVGYHKPGKLIKDEVFIPIHLGRRLAKQKYNDNKFSENDYNWMLDNMIGDDTGDNISNLNREFCELSGIYWAWKNYDKIGNPDYIGFMHYRRHFFVNKEIECKFDEIPDHIVFPKISDEYIKQINLDKVIKEAIDSDIVLPYFFNMSKTFGNQYIKIKDFYKNKQKQFYDFDKTVNILKNLHPEYSSIVDEYYEQENIYFKNMFIMKKDEFFSFCNFVFKILFENHKQIDYKKLPENKIREIAHVAEIVFGIYFYNKIKNSTLKIKYLPITYISEAPSCKILVSYHKKDFLIKNDIYTPIHSGRDVAFNSSKDGIISKEEYNWLNKNTVGDNTGDNISSKNRNYAEVTSIYWAWKNYERLNNPDYIGFTHYRRQFIFNPHEQKETRVFIDNLNSEKMHHYMSSNDIYNTIKTNDICMVKPIKWKTSLYQQYYDAHEIKDLDFVLEIIKKKYPNYYENANKYLKNNQSIFGNIWIMKKDVFFEYCEFLFDILSKLEKTVILDKYSLYNQRVCGFMAERLTGIFIYNKLQEKKLKIKQLTTSFINTSQEELLPAFDKNNIPVFCATSSNYVPYCATLIQSIIANSSVNNNYDIIIMHSNITSENCDKLVSLIRNHKNFSLRFINMNKYEKFIKSKFSLVGKHLSYETYYRLFAGTLLNKYPKMLYLDIDTIVLDDIAKLYNIDIGTNILGACQDFGVVAKIKSNKWEKCEYFKNVVKIKYPIREYIQAGILIFNLDEFRKQNIEAKLMDTLSENKFMYDDQDALNYTTYKKVKLLDSSWNITTEEGTKKGIMCLMPKKMYLKYLEDRKNPKIIHYASFVKPWSSPNSDLAQYWWQYARLTPFYEEILYKNLKSKPAAKQNSISLDFAKILAKRHRIIFNYYRCKLLSKLTFGKKRKHYKEKRNILKQDVRKIRDFVKR